MKKLLIIDDHPIFRTGMRKALEDRGEFGEIAEAGSIAEALALLEERDFDLVVVDLALPDGSGLSILEDWARRPSAPAFFVLSMSSDRSLVRKAMGLGASGYSSKNIALDTLVLGLRLVAAGEIFIESELLRDLLTAGVALAPDRPELSARLNSLSDREREVFGILLEGESAKEAAARLGVSQRTAENYQSSLYAKLGARSPVDLVRIALRAGLSSSV